ncbi:hypothetical protein RJ641_023242, partial [Dillenia turbinata]
DCIGAIDGTNVHVKIGCAEAPKYHGRKDYPTQNILIAWLFDLKFTYVLSRWEKSVSDSKILKNSLRRENKADKLVSQLVRGNKLYNSEC